MLRTVASKSECMFTTLTFAIDKAILNPVFFLYNLNHFIGNSKAQSKTDVADEFFKIKYQNNPHKLTIARFNKIQKLNLFLYLVCKFLF